VPRTKHKETALFVVTDTHVGKATASYDREAVVRRMGYVAQRVTKLTDMLRSDYEFDGLELCFLGDGPDGSDIYPTQAHHQGETNPEVQALDMVELVICPLAKALRQSYREVRLRVISGNHGRIGRGAHEAASWDATAYRLAEARLARERGITFALERDIPEVRAFMVRGHKFLLYHGHGIKSYMGIPFYGVRQRMLNWNSTDEYGGFRVLHIGHFHSFGRMQHNRLTAMLNGTMVSGDGWALNQLGYESAQLWHLHGVSEERPITFDFGVDTSDESSSIRLDMHDQTR
jgi:predicted phosphodiesterase